MTTLIILLAQTKSGAIIEILSLLLVAALIGYITSWFYQRSIHKKRTKILEFERHEFNNRIINLNSEISKLNASIDEKNAENEHQQLEIKAFKALHKEAVHETDGMKLKNLRTEHFLYNKDEVLNQLIQRKHLLNYKNFGIATEAEKDDLKMISGIGPLIEERLHALEIFTFSQISKFTAHDIAAINDAIIYFSGRIEKDEWVAQARELLNSEEMRMELLKKIRDRKALIHYNRIGTATIEEADDLTTISGIGGWIMSKLNALDIYTFQQISKFTEDDVKTVTEAIEYFPGRIERDEWILQASELVLKNGKKSELVKSIEGMKKRIYFDRLGRAYLHQANNLTLINGIGIWSEERLNMLGIYTYEQISKLRPLDIETIAEILAISPTRIANDKWISQANTLANRHVSIKMFPKN